MPSAGRARDALPEAISRHSGAVLWAFVRLVLSAWLTALNRDAFMPDAWEGGSLARVSLRHRVQAI